MGQDALCRLRQIDDLRHVGEVVAGKGDYIRPPARDHRVIGGVILDLKIEELDLVPRFARRRGDQLQSQRFQPQKHLGVHQRPGMNAEKFHGRLPRDSPLKQAGGRFGVCYSTTIFGGARGSAPSWLATCAAIARKISAYLLCGAEATMGVPPSEVSRIARSSGTSPRNGTPSFSASWRAPPWAKMSVRSPQWGQRKYLIFSTIPRIG